MARSDEERELTESFDADYRMAQNDLMLELERVVCGCDYGAAPAGPRSPRPNAWGTCWAWDRAAAS